MNHLSSIIRRLPNGEMQGPACWQEILISVPEEDTRHAMYPPIRDHKTILVAWEGQHLKKNKFIWSILCMIWIKQSGLDVLREKIQNLRKSSPLCRLCRYLHLWCEGTNHVAAWTGVWIPWQTTAASAILMGGWDR